MIIPLYTIITVTIVKVILYYIMKKAEKKSSFTHVNTVNFMMLTIPGYVLSDLFFFFCYFSCSLAMYGKSTDLWLRLFNGPTGVEPRVMVISNGENDGRGTERAHHCNRGGCVL